MLKHVLSDRHACKPPNWFQCWFNKIGPGSVWQCDVCFREFTLHEDEDGTYWHRRVD